MKINSLIAILITLSFFACNKDEEEKAVTTGNISGTVALFDDGTAGVDNSGMTVTVEGTSPEISSQSDSDGDFTIENVPFGTYTLSFTKTAYGTFKYFDVTLTESGGNYNITEAIDLGQKSDLTVSNFTVYISHGNIDYIGDVDPAGTVDMPKYVRIFYDMNENVSSSNYSYYSEAYQVVGSDFEIPITKEKLIEEGFESGSTVYLKIYGESYWNNSYEDPSIGKIVFPNLSPNSPDAVSFIVP